MQVSDDKLRKKLEKQTLKSGWVKRQLEEQLRQVVGSDRNTESKDGLQRPVGRPGLLRVRQLVRSGKEIERTDRSFIAFSHLQFEL